MRLGLGLVISATLVAAAGCGSRSSPWRPADRGGRLDGRVDVYYWFVDALPPRPDLKVVPRKDTGVVPPGKTCQSTCASKADCPPPFIDCAAGRCVLCKADTDCAAAPYKGGCNVSLGICRLCKSDADCVVGGFKLLTGRCDAASGMCVGCQADADCAFTGSVYKICNTTTWTCGMCKSDADCTWNTLKGCDPTTKLCARCTSHEQCCSGVPGCGLTCHLPTGRCLCTSASQCLDAHGSGSGQWLCQ